MKIDYQTIISNIIAFIMSLYSAYAAYAGYDDLSQADMTKYAAIGTGGLGYILYSNFSKITSLFSKGETKSPSARVFMPEDFEEQDFRCLVHLRNRVTEADSQEGIDACEKLNGIVFALHTKERVGEKTSQSTPK